MRKIRASFNEGEDFEEISVVELPILEIFDPLWPIEYVRANKPYQELELRPVQLMWIEIAIFIFSRLPFKN